MFLWIDNSDPTVHLINHNTPFEPIDNNLMPINIYPDDRLSSATMILDDRIVQVVITQNNHGCTRNRKEVHWEIKR